MRRRGCIWIRQYGLGAAKARLRLSGHLEGNDIVEECGGEARTQSIPWSRDPSLRWVVGARCLAFAALKMGRHSVSRVCGSGRLLRVLGEWLRLVVKPSLDSS